LIKAYEIADKDNFLGTDDASLVERINGKIKIYVGEYDNIKVTTIDDLKFFE
jgi:2-C-methyl-D-erythritol 4-phosphate cytidylyltransferase